jgi:hypothetical protein
MQTMADEPNEPAADERTTVGSGAEPAPRTPRWVIALGIIAMVLILAVAAQFVLGLQHEPGLHGGANEQPVPRIAGS